MELMEDRCCCQQQVQKEALQETENNIHDQAYSLFKFSKVVKCDYDMTWNFTDGEQKLEELAFNYILNAFYGEMNWIPAIGSIVTTDSLICEFKLSRVHQHLLCTFLHRLCENGSAGILKPLILSQIPLRNSWKIVKEPPPRSWIRQRIKLLQTELLAFPFLKSEINLLNYVGPHLYNCLRGHVNSSSVLFPSEDSFYYKSSLLPYYENSLWRRQSQFKYIRVILGQIILKFAKPCPEENGQPIVRILEIGGGSGGSTRVFLQQLDSFCTEMQFPGRIRYTFTDSSNFMLGKAKATLQPQNHNNLTRSELKSWIRQNLKSGRAFNTRNYINGRNQNDEIINFEHIELEYALLDVEQDPFDQLQEFGHESYDIVIAVDVLHETRFLDTALTHVKQLLKPNNNGILVLGESFKSTIFAEVAFGLNENWWKYADKIRNSNNCPLLSANEWRTVLSQFGFKFSSTFSVGENETFGVIIASCGQDNKN